jgi:hypothetical protein
MGIHADHFLIPDRTVVKVNIDTTHRSATFARRAQWDTTASPRRRAAGVGGALVPAG